MWAQSCFAQAASARMDSAGSRAAGADLLKEADLAGLMAQRAVLDGGTPHRQLGNNEKSKPGSGRAMEHTGCVRRGGESGGGLATPLIGGETAGTRTKTENLNETAALPAI